MTRLLICAFAVLLGCDKAFAADLANYSEPTTPSASVWTGLHVGISGGFGSNQDNAPYSYVNVPPDEMSLLPKSAKLNADGGLVGGPVGFDKQFGQIVRGLEGDLSWTGFDDNAIHHVPGDPSIEFPPLKFEAGYEMDWLSTIRGRAGMAFNNWLPYGTAGVAFGRVSLDSSVAVGDFGSLTGSKETTKM
jgi:outer membrane immunogenic protein